MLWLFRKREISATPIQLHLKEVYGECYPLNLAPNPEKVTLVKLSEDVQ